MKRGTISFLKVAIFIIGMIILVLCAWLPGLASDAARMNPEYAYLQYPVLVGVYISVIPFFLALFQAFKLLGYIENGSAFSQLAVISLQSIKYCAIAISIIYAAGSIMLISQNALHPGIAIIGLVIIFTSLVISVFSGLLQALLSRALEIKTENDLTV
jgi:hypothetical protein